MSPPILRLVGSPSARRAVIGRADAAAAEERWGRGGKNDETRRMLSFAMDIIICKEPGGRRGGDRASQPTGPSARRPWPRVIVAAVDSAADKRSAAAANSAIVWHRSSWSAAARRLVVARSRGSMRPDDHVTTALPASEPASPSALL